MTHCFVDPAHCYLISRLPAMGDRNAQFYFNVLQ
jgi:hypothetical protein